MKNWQKITVGAGTLGVIYSFIRNFDTLMNYQIIAIVIGVFYLLKQFRN